MSATRSPEYLVGVGHELCMLAKDSTRAVLFGHRPLSKMDRADRLRACYLHACLQYVNRQYLTNTSLRERFGLDEKNSAMASRFIKEAVAAA